MEEITNLINTAKTAIDNLEKFIFENKKERYINLKSVTDFMTNQIDSAEMAMELQVEEGYEEAKAKLDAIVAKCNELMEIFKTSDNVMIIINENGEIITQEIKYENTQAPMETPVMEFGARRAEEIDSSTNYEYTASEENLGLAQNMSLNSMDTTNAFNEVPSIDIMDGQSETKEEHQVFAPEVKEAPLIDASVALETPVPEISILDDTTTQHEATDYSKDLDVAAVDAFLGSESQENTLKL